ncbi:MAG: hypothetical protein JXR52_12965 [Bacteroidales bacterium]|nr:hypothetical protein [Bacteroidales bacterium]MBN2699730.1 hypothetical protein [Bacteroidales bacterium]
MKTHKFKLLPILTLSLAMMLPLNAQSGMEDGSRYGHGEDSINCLMNLSLYREFFKHNNYKDAISPWRKVFTECPASSEKMYVDGVQMYRSLIESSSTPAEQIDPLIDTLMLIYDRRAEYFGGLGNILGRKGIDRLRYRRDDIESINTAYEELKESIKIDNKESRDAVMITFISASITLNRSGKISDDQTIDDYFMVTEIIDELLGKSSRWERAKTTIDDNMLSSGILTCEALNTYFIPKFDANNSDKELLKNIIRFYTASGCDRSDLYVSASEQLYKIEPSPQAAHNLAILLISKNELRKAVIYLKEACSGTGIETDEKAEWYYELALVSRANRDNCEAIKFAREAVSLKGDLGKAYILMGDAFIDSRDNLGEDFEQRTAFWAAADKYIKAKSVDPGVADEATQKINDYAVQYPNHEEVFFRDLKDGDSYYVGGCINEYTTVRSRK